MNYLSHAYLSLGNTDLLIGNLMGDFVKGNSYKSYNRSIQQGILLHRFIDTFTDKHELVFKAINLLKPSFRLSAGVFVDIFFDHFLANSFYIGGDLSLDIFTKNIYSLIENNKSVLGEEMYIFFTHMKNHNWLYNYKYIEGIEKTIHGMCKRYPRLGDAEIAMQLFSTYYYQFEDIFYIYFPILEKACIEKIKT